MATIDAEGARSSVETGYLTRDVTARSNLKIAVGIMVEKIIMSKSTASSKPRAIGVQLSTSREGPKFCVAAKNEVLLCAGAIATPQILMLSGIGSAGQLKRHGVPVVLDLPCVGKSLRDHISSGSMILRAKPGTTWDYLTKPASAVFALLQWVLYGSGPMSGKGTQVAAFLRADDEKLPKLSATDRPVKDLTSGPNSPDIELIYAPLVAVVDGKPTPGLSGVTAVTILLKPASEGTVELRSSSVYDHPIINPNYLSDENDITMMLRGMRLMLHIARVKPLSDFLDLGKDMNNSGSIFWPGDCGPDEVPDEALVKWVQQNAQTPWHPACTAKMGQSADTSVVDSQLKVHGVEGLRVMDTSVFPTQVSGHSCAVVIAMAERLSDIIKGVL